MSNLQEIFDNAYQHIIVEKNPPGVTPRSFGDGFKCSYLTPDGNACAIGISLIGYESLFDEIEQDYYMEMDFGKVFLYLREQVEQIFPGLEEEVLELLPKLGTYEDFNPHHDDDGEYREEYVSEFLQNFQLDLHDALVNLKTGEWKYTFDELKEKYIELAKEYHLTVPE